MCNQFLFGITVPVFFSNVLKKYEITSPVVHGLSRCFTRGEIPFTHLQPITASILLLTGTVKDDVCKSL